ncbi:MAG: polysaccharide deacetylase family protein [Rhodospirillaceae bacterium]|nr:polysaccharide deacetylase family protein [Rhodospirillaceae bacterium]MBT7487650.1 polysaccharide deacetylase family protein [Rhodospirillales bacterium]MBT5036367.1 polysaccharide deacetylase family protein [Rhodospirillaceae bacterium]MBT6222269.1 polysaccharide deacetylase family protein [Rhodospirillaceae bacterium]MBT6363041.1 polysaccharide deacetylase family protein [Rhodospirillaceae bacterium]
MESVRMSTNLKDRITYDPIEHRKKLKLPGGARVAVWTVVTVEVWDPSGPLPRQVLSAPGGQRWQPDVPNWCWSEYGARVAFWRMKRILDEFNIKATLCINGSVCDHYPQIIDAAIESDWEFMGHNIVQKPMHMMDDERQAIFDTAKIIQERTGKKLRGWMGPGLTETDDTPDYLTEAGMDYTTDWVIDDQPCPIETKNGTLYSIPYSVETNDVVMSAIQTQPSSEIYDRIMDQFECFYEEGEEQPRVLSVCSHPYLSGVPHRIKYFRKIYEELTKKQDVVFWTGDQIIDWYKDAVR